MPAITSPLSALRFSGRLMVIQNACPRFSSFTLPSVIYPARSFTKGTIAADICGRITGDCKDDLAVRNQCRPGLLHPHLVVMECGAADRRYGACAGERVDAAAADMGLVGMNGFRDQHAAMQAVEQFCAQRGLAAGIAEGDGVAIGNPERSGVSGMNHHARLALARDRGRRFVEGRVEEAARRAGGQSKRMRL